jgi:hypothetical protein
MAVTAVTLLRGREAGPRNLPLLHVCAIFVRELFFTAIGRGHENSGHACNADPDQRVDDAEAGNPTDERVLRLSEREQEAAYRRGDMLKKRQRLMADWAAYCASSNAKGGAAPPYRRRCRAIMQLLSSSCRNLAPFNFGQLRCQRGWPEYGFGSLVLSEVGWITLRLPDRGRTRHDATPQHYGTLES